MPRAVNADALEIQIIGSMAIAGIISEQHKPVFNAVIKEVKKLIDEAPTIELPKQEWISVKDEVPELGRRILICGKNGGINIATRHFEGVDNEAQVSCSSAQRRFTHWMPLPEPPEKNNEEEQA